MKTLQNLFGLLALLAIQISDPLVAQPDNFKWGDVPIEDIRMKSYPADSNASVLILGDYGNVWFDKSLRMVFERHTRIKIFTEAGYDDWATVSKSYYANDHRQKLKGIEGRTYNLGADGKLEVHKLDKKSIFEEKDGNWKRVKFTLPALKPGSVIEYRYRLESKYASDLPNWTFQKNEPVRWSEFKTRIPEIFQYVSSFQGTEPFDINEKEMFYEDYTWNTKIYGRTFILQESIRGSQQRWVIKDIPALRKEPYMTTPSDYRAKIRFQLSHIKPPNSYVTKVLSTWEELAKNLSDYPDFGKQVGKHKVLRQRAQVISEKIESPLEKMIAVYDDLRATMKWNEQYDIYCDEALDKAFKKRNGGVAEINLMLTSMLRDVGLDAYPVIISTRDHGHIQPYYPLVNQFNSVLSYVKIAEKEYLLDATDNLRPYNLLPVAALNHSGYLIDKNDHRWVEIPSSGKYNHFISVIASLNSDGSLTASLQSSADGYKSLFDREKLQEEDEQDFVKETFLFDFISVKIDSFSILNKEEVQKPLKTSVYFSIPDFAQVAGDFIYLNPMIVEGQNENPFKLSERTFPVDFAYRRSFTYTLNLTLPKEYAIQEKPRNVAVRLPNSSGEFRRIAQVSGNHFSLMNKTVIRKTVFEPEEYQSLRGFYNQMVKAHSEKIVLKRETNYHFRNK